MNVVLIGLGKIACYHIAALTATPRYVICGVCDRSEQAVARADCPDIPFFTDYEQMLDALRPDIAVIATPPASHYAIVMACLQRGVIPFVEKPLETDAPEGQRFLEPPLRGRFVPIHHTLYGEEQMWFEAHCPMQHIRTVHMELSDPYADAEGHIADAFIGLGGCWLDSAPNALAPLLQLLPHYALTNVQVCHQRDERNGLPYVSILTAQAGETQVRISIHWDKGVNRKVTTIEADDHLYVLNHSEQSVYRDGMQLFAYTDQARLLRQYCNFYRMYPERVPTEQQIEQIYSIIYQNL